MSIVFSYLVSALFFMALVFFVLQVGRWGRYWPAAYVLVAVALIVPVGDWLLIEFIRGYLSDLSIPSIFLLSAYVLNAIKIKQSFTISPVFKIWVLLMGIVIIPMSLGATQFDPFTLGYPSNESYKIMLIVSLAFGLFAWFFGETVLALAIALALCLHGLDVYESSNLWTYLMDPIAVIICMFSFLFSGLKRLFSRLSFVER